MEEGEERRPEKVVPRKGREGCEGPCSVILGVGVKCVERMVEGGVLERKAEQNEDARVRRSSLRVVVVVVVDEDMMWCWICCSGLRHRSL